MGIAFWTGATGMRAYQSDLDVTAHNIANVNTTGFKARRAAFDDLLRSRINTNVQGEHLVGHGVKQEYVDLIFAQSGLDQTLQPLDFAVAGNGFFAVDAQGTRQYTRDGTFNLSVEGNGAALVTQDGAYVLDANGNHITVPLDANGSPDITGLKDQIGLFNFANPFGLTPENGNRFSVSANSGAATAVAQDQDNQIIQYALENSAVDLAKEMTEVIAAQRAYQMNARVVQTDDAMMELVNNLR